MTTEEGKVVISFLGYWEEIQRTEDETINPLGLPEETVDLVHLVYPSFRPAFFFDHCVDLLAERFYIFRILKKTIQ